MAKSTYLQLVNRTVRECGISGNGAATVLNQRGILQKVVTWVAEADMYVQRLYRDWDFLHTQHSFTTIASTVDYTKPTDMGLWDGKSFYTDYTTATAQQLLEVPYEEYRKRYGMGVQTQARPSVVSFRPNKDIILYPTPDAVYTVTADYWKLPTRLVANTDTSDIPEFFEDVIIHRAKMLYAEHEEAGDMLQTATQEFGLALTDLKANEAPAHYAMNMASQDFTVQVY